MHAAISSDSSLDAGRRGRAVASYDKGPTGHMQAAAARAQIPALW